MNINIISYKSKKDFLISIPLWTETVSYPGFVNIGNEGALQYCGGNMQPRKARIVISV